MDWALAPSARNTMVIRIAGQNVVFKVPSTKSWDIYQWQKFGAVKLEPGDFRVVAQSVGALRGPLIDLRTIKLLPPGSKAPAPTPPPPVRTVSTPPKRTILRPAKSVLKPITIAKPMHPLIPIGTAKIDITPTYPITLAGYSGRRQETDQVVNKLWVRALALGDDDPAVILAVENCGVPAYLTEEVAAALKKSAGLKRERFLVCSTHTHNAPTLTGWAVGMYGDSLPAEQRQRTARYTAELAVHMVNAAKAALTARKPARLAWAQGMAGFGGNRRALRGDRWRGFGFQKDGVVDHSLPLLVAVDEKNMPFALVANYACHCTTMGASRNICGDWAGFASQFMEQNHPGAVALMTVGCGADVGPQPTGALQHAQRHGLAIAEEVQRLLNAPLQPLTPKLSTTFKKIRLPFAQTLPREHWLRFAGHNNANGYRARHLLKRLDAGEGPITHLEYPIASWTFGEDLAMVFLGGEVVVDYALLLKQRLDPKRLWVSSYSNDVPCYIPTKRILKEGGYEAGYSMVLYGQPSSFAPEVEKIVMDGVESIIPQAFKSVSKKVDSLTNELTIRKTAAGKR
jgi:hypothetical protein